MKVKIRSSENYRDIPAHSDELAHFVYSNIENVPLIKIFYFIINDCSSFSKFESYERVFVAQTLLEQSLITLLRKFYSSAEEQNDIPNQRGYLLEHIVKIILESCSKVKPKCKHAVILDVRESGNCVITTDPFNIDFYAEFIERVYSSGIECKVKVFKDIEKLATLNGFSQFVLNNKLLSDIVVVHLNTNEKWTKQYDEWYKYLDFTVPHKLYASLT